jgi:CheY-like chemotaxis protein
MVGGILMDARKRILVVDDSEDLRDFYKLALEDAGYEVSVASSGQEGLDQAHAHHPDLIVLDVVMPGMGGLEVLARIRSDFAPPLPPVILVSGFDIAEGEALRRGALMFVRKPVTLEGLLAYVKQGVLSRPVSGEVDARERSRATEARRRARQEAARLAGRFSKLFEERKGASLRWLANYFGLGTAALSLLEEDRLPVIAWIGDPSFSRGTDLGERLPQSYEIVETKTSLVIPDASMNPFFATALGKVAGVRFFAGVPVLAPDKTPIGVLCVLDAQPRAMAAEDLLILEHFGSIASSRMLTLERAESEPDRGPAVWDRETFTLLIDAEARLLHRDGGSMELDMVEVDDLRTVSAALAHAPVRERLAASVVGAERMAICKRDRTDGAARELQAVLGEVRAAGSLRAAGAASIAGSGPPAVAGQDLLHLAEVALDNALEVGGGTQRLVLQHEVSAPTMN